MKPLLLTMGDAAGIGPETIVKAWLAEAAPDAVVVGSVAVMRRAVQQLQASLPIAVLSEPDEPAPAGALADDSSLQVWLCRGC